MNAMCGRGGNRGPLTADPRPGGYDVGHIAQSASPAGCHQPSQADDAEEQCAWHSPGRMSCALLPTLHGSAGDAKSTVLPTISPAAMARFGRRIPVSSSETTGSNGRPIVSSERIESCRDRPGTTGGGSRACSKRAARAARERKGCRRGRVRERHRHACRPRRHRRVRT